MAQLSAIYAQTKRITSPANEIPHSEEQQGKGGADKVSNTFPWCEAREGTVHVQYYNGHRNEAIL